MDLFLHPSCFPQRRFDKSFVKNILKKGMMLLLLSHMQRIVWIRQGHIKCLLYFCVRLYGGRKDSIILPHRLSQSANFLHAIML